MTGWNECTKTAYLTQAQARAAMRGLTRGSDRRSVRIYHCEKCGCWHLTSRTRAQERELRKRVRAW